MDFNTPQMYRWKDPSADPRTPALSVHFVHESFVNAKVTAERGVQTYDDVLMAYVAPMGMPKSNASCEIERTLPDGTVVVNPWNMAKYGEQVRHYKAGATAEAVGTPLRDLVGMTPATIMNLKARGLHTIEMLAETADSMSGEMMGFWEWRDKARKHLEAREKNAPTVRLEMELETQRQVNESLQRQLEELKALVQVDDKKPAKKAA
jgi:hypothetical protein